jgi:preprotein translocase subunit YajC
LSQHSLIILAQTEAPTPPQKPGAFGYEFFIVIIIFMVAYYFLIQRPQKRQEEDKKKAIDSLKKGDKVVSIGGIHGQVAKVNKEKETVTVTVAKGVEIEFNRSAIIVQPEPAATEKKD